MLKLSVLDQSIMRQNSTSAQIIAETIEAAQLADHLGFHRFWVSEHHNVPMMIGSTPEILMVKLADETKRIRIGSGGVMLPNYSVLKVAENFRMLEILFPNRIDLGIGNSSGGDQATSLLLNPNNFSREEDYKQQLNDLQALLNDNYVSKNSNIINAFPQSTTVPQQWILAGSPKGSSLLAAKYGMGLVLALSLIGRVSPEVIHQYENNFCPSQHLSKPQVMLCVTVLCAETNKKAEELRIESEYYQLRMEKGNISPIGGQSEIQNSGVSIEDINHIKTNYNHIISGNPIQVRLQLNELAKEYSVNEIMINSMVYSHEMRLRSLRLLAEEFDLSEN